MDSPSRWLAAWALYLAGAAIIWIFDTYWFSRISAYPVYNRLLTLSERIQGAGSNGPWNAAYKRARAGE